MEGVSKSKVYLPGADSKMRIDGHPSGVYFGETGAERISWDSNET